MLTIRPKQGCCCRRKVLAESVDFSDHRFRVFESDRNLDGFPGNMYFEGTFCNFSFECLKHDSLHNVKCDRQYYDFFRFFFLKTFNASFIIIVVYQSRRIITDVLNVSRNIEEWNVLSSKTNMWSRGPKNRKQLRYSVTSENKNVSDIKSSLFISRQKTGWKRRVRKTRGNDVAKREKVRFLSDSPPTAGQVLHKDYTFRAPPKARGVFMD